MNRNQNHFRALLMLSFSLFVFGCSLSALAQRGAKEFPVNLLFSKDDVPHILENAQRPLFQEYWGSLLKADFEKDQNYLREAFIYALTGDKKRGQNARRAMLEMLKRKRWDYFLEDNKHTLGFLRAGRNTAWMSLGYDWCYDLFSPAEREQILSQIAEKGCVPLYRALYGFRYPETVKHWGFDPEADIPYEVPDMSRWPIILGHNNFRAVISGGFALGMFTIWDRDERVEEWYEMLLDSYDWFVDLLMPDGSYDEGVAYCNYAMTYLIYMMEAFECKNDINLFDGANFIGMMEYSLAMYMPHLLSPRSSVNFGDADKSLNSAVGFWVARHSRDGLSQYIAENYHQDHDIFSLVYYDPTVKPVPPVEKKLFKKLDLDWIITRTGFDIDDLVVAMRSGPPMNHEHADRNSILLKAYGEILLADPLRPTYDPNSPGWLLRTGLGHNTVLIDGKSHQYHLGEEGTNASDAWAQIVRYGRRPGYDFWASDATQAYQLVN
ncbi:MAG: heparinase II/III family protein, partial [bacterium]|nr:heparinase II/III family protein [bacterium]